MVPGTTTLLAPGRSRFPMDNRPAAHAGGRTVPVPPLSDDGSRSEVLATSDGQRPWGSFHLATVMFRRAVQLRGGAKPRVEVNGHKFLQLARLEVTAGTIPWEVTGG